MSDPSLAKDKEMIYSPHNSPTLKPPLSFPLRTEQRIPLIGIKTSCGGFFRLLRPQFHWLRP